MDQPADWIEIIENSQEKVRLLQQTKYSYEKKIRDIETEILEEKVKLSNECVALHGEHELVTEREQGPYGERFTYCKRCSYPN